MLKTDFIESPQLGQVTHAFFTRTKGHSTGLYAKGNAGLGSGDVRANVEQNRADMAETLGVQTIHSLYQVHSANVVIADDHTGKDRPKADGIVTATSGLALGIVTADCGPVLLADASAGIVGACHAGWKGALGGVLENTIETMRSIGASRDHITAVLGPTISAAHYEVGPDFPKPFVERDADATRFFASSAQVDHHMFDLPAYIVWRLETAGVKAHALPVCTYADAEHFFSYRRTTHAKEPDYGRQLSAIVCP